MNALRHTFTSRWRAGLAAMAALVALSGAGWAMRGEPAQAVAPATASTPAPALAAQIAPAKGVDSYADLVAQVAPAVVTVRADRRGRQTASQDDDLLRRFFGDRGPGMPMPRREGALGSGAIVSAEGYVLTNNHVVEHAEQINVELHDRRVLSAKLVGADPPSDLAVLKIEAVGLKNLPLADSDRARVGDVVLAIGNPLGLGQTVTMGIISATGRATGFGEGTFEDFLQTDAPINHGNSGGPLINTRGELIGINSQILSPSGGNIGIGFAIPATMARNVMDQLVKTGTVKRGMLGVTIQPVTSDIASSLGLAEVRGAIVNSVTTGSPADRAGIKRGDVITKLNGASISDSNSLRNHVAKLQPGSQVTLTVMREGKERSLTATLGERRT
jgi:Do/DeqQ family serine protease